ncbi:MAG TPA: diaminopimelate epimerase [Symbiobacteriaceae bacterium]|nr:diaminopimelate epimerase [Symbiobacteriaceae bacterium]
MEGLGNDYVYVNNFAEKLPEDKFPALSVAVAERHFGVGSDGLIVILPPTSPEHDFRFRMFNADGSEGEMCGNGIRCFARYCYDRGLTTKTTFKVETLAGTIIPEIILSKDGQVMGVRVDMGKPRLQRSLIPMAGADVEKVVDEPFEVDGRTYRITTVSMGNPHVMIYVDDVDSVDLEYIGPKIEKHALFPKRINVHFVQVISPSELKMRTWERGSGITLACGTGASAVLVASHLLGRSDRSALIHLPGGDLKIEWDEATGHVFKTGPATYVCNGEFLKTF